MNPVPLFLIAISLPLLLGSLCHAELRIWTAVNGKEVDAKFVSIEKGIVNLKLKSGKVFEVPAKKLSKEDNEFISSLAKPEDLNLKIQEVNLTELEEREGAVYLKDSNKPYTGKCYLLYQNDQKKIEVNFKDGLQDGSAIGWYENGQKKSEENYKNGKLNGLIKGWYKDGQKYFEVNYDKGLQEGLGIMWYENGQKKNEGNYKMGKPDKLYTEWHENGHKEREENWKDGKLEGAFVSWYENGQEKYEGIYNQGEFEGLWTKWHENGQKGKQVIYNNGLSLSRKYWNSKGQPVDLEEEAFK